MKKQIVICLLLALLSGLSLKQSSQNGKNPGNICLRRPGDRRWTLQFDHASRSGVPQNSNSFSLQFNGVTIKEWLPTDYNIHHQTINLVTLRGRNRISFIGTGISDGLGHTIDNIRLYTSRCEQRNVVVNGGFEEGHSLGVNWAIFANNQIPGWKTLDNELQIGWGKIYNEQWPNDTHVCELDANHNANVYQDFLQGNWF